MITIVDYGMGNLGSILNMFKRIGVKAVVTTDPEVIRSAEKILLPGVGAFDVAMTHINGSGLREILDQKAKVERIPILGICLGMQLFTRGSEEGELPGLGWIPGETKRFPGQADLKVPHMGWNMVIPSTPSCLTRNLPAESRFYFVHSYCVTVDDPKHSILKTHYGVEFESGLAWENIYGVQFHPEKSHKFGMQLLKNFAGL